ncbi:MAG: hypothetical protein RR867_03240 [Ruthenibacterium sp.]
MLQNWNRDVKQIQAEQDGLKAKMNFSYVGHGPKATGFMSKTFKRKPGLYVRCTQCGYYMPLDGKGTEDCICGNLHRDEHTFKSEISDSEVEVFKANTK